MSRENHGKEVSTKAIFLETLKCICAFMDIILCFTGFFVVVLVAITFVYFTLVVFSNDIDTVGNVLLQIRTTLSEYLPVTIAGIVSLLHFCAQGIKIWVEEKRILLEKH